MNAAKLMISPDPEKANFSPDDLAKKFHDDCILRGINPRASMTYTRAFIGFLQARGKTPLEVEESDMETYLISLKSRSLKPSSLDRIFASISQFYSFLTYKHLIGYNPIIPFKQRYLHRYKEDSNKESRQLISIKDASRLANSILNSRDKAIVWLLLKTGMRREEMRNLDISDINIEKKEILLKLTAKRSNRLLFFDDETAEVLESWLHARRYRSHGSNALFPGRISGRITGWQINEIVKAHAERVGLHNPNSARLEDQFTAHCCRHWLTTHLWRAGMPTEYIMVLRGDSMKGLAFNRYNKIDMELLREKYMACIPQLGV